MPTTSLLSRLARGVVDQPCLVTVGVCAAGGLGVAVLPAGAWRLLALGPMMMLVPGLLIAPKVTGEDPIARAAVTIGSSIALWTIVTQTTALADIWNPNRVFAAIALLSAVVALIEHRRTASARSEAHDGDPHPTPAGATGSPRWLTVAQCLLAATATIAFFLTVHWTDFRAAGDAGLVSALPAAYFVGVSAALVGFTLELFHERSRGPVIAAFVALTVLFLFGTAAAIDEVPRFAWAYRHVGVAEYLQSNGTVNRRLDIYNNWPGFFALAAHISTVSGVPVLLLARWAQLFFGLLNALAVAFVAGSLTKDIRVRSLTVMVFTLANWVGQDYFAPQALGFVLTVVMLGVMLGTLRTYRARRRIVNRLTRITTTAIGRTADLRPDLLLVHESAPGRPATRRWGAAVVLLLFAGVTVTHQLSPFMAILFVAGLVAMRRIRFAWLPAAMLAMTVGWIALAHDYFDANPELLRIRLSRRNVNAAGASENFYDFSRISSGGHLVQVLSLGFCLAVWYLAAMGLVRRVRSGVADAEAVVFLVAPAVFVAANSYGGEGILRVYLFSLPAASFLAASMLLPRRSSWHRPGVRSLTFLLLLATAASFTITSFGRDQFNLLRPGEVAAARALESAAPPLSTLTTFGEYWPAGSTARYAELGYYVKRVLAGDRTYIHRTFSADDAEFIADDILAISPTDGGFLAASTSQEQFIDTYGLMPPGEYEHLVSIIDNSSRFRRWLVNEDVVIWQALPPPDLP